MAAKVTKIRTGKQGTPTVEQGTPTAVLTAELAMLAALGRAAGQPDRDKIAKAAVLRWYDSLRLSDYATACEKSKLWLAEQRAILLAGLAPDASREDKRREYNKITAWKRHFQAAVKQQWHVRVEFKTPATKPVVWTLAKEQAPAIDRIAGAINKQWPYLPENLAERLCEGLNNRNAAGLAKAQENARIARLDKLEPQISAFQERVTSIAKARKIEELAAAGYVLAADSQYVQAYGEWLSRRAAQ